MILGITTLWGAVQAVSQQNLSLSKERSSLIIGFNDFPPYAIEEGYNISSRKNGICSYSEHIGFGIDPDFLIAVVSHAGMDSYLVFHPYARTKSLLKNNEIDATAGFFYKEINGRPKYRYILYDMGGLTKVYAKNNVAEGLTKFRQLKFLKLGVVREEYFHNAVLNEAIYKSKSIIPALFANSYHQLFNALAEGRVEVVAANNVVGDYILANMGMYEVEASPLQFSYGNDPKQDGIYIAVSTAIADDIFYRLKKSAQKLLEHGYFRCIQEKYGVVSNN